MRRRIFAALLAGVMVFSVAGAALAEKPGKGRGRGSVSEALRCSTAAEMRAVIEQRNISVKGALDDDGETLLMKAAKRRVNPELITELVKMGADVNARDEDGETALMKAVDKRAPLGVVRALLSAGADVNAREEDGETALIIAVDEGASEDVIRALLDAGADVKIRDEDGRTAGDYAARKKRGYSDEIMNRLR